MFKNVFKPLPRIMACTKGFNVETFERASTLLDFCIVENNSGLLSILCITCDQIIIIIFKRWRTSQCKYSLFTTCYLARKTSQHYLRLKKHVPFMKTRLAVPTNMSLNDVILLKLRFFKYYE